MILMLTIVGASCVVYSSVETVKQSNRYITVKCISLKDGSIQLDKAYVGQYEADARAYQFLVKDDLGNTTEKIEMDAKTNSCTINEKLKSSASSN
jgi:hypothetical protein